MRGEDSDNNYAKIWVRDSALPSCNHDDLNMDGDTMSMNSFNPKSSSFHQKNSFNQSFKSPMATMKKFGSVNNSFHLNRSPLHKSPTRSPPTSMTSGSDGSVREGSVNGNGNGGINREDSIGAQTPHKGLKRGGSSMKSMKEGGGGGAHHHHHHHPDWDQKIMPLLNVGLKRLLHSQWPTVPLVQPNKKRPSVIKNVLENKTISEDSTIIKEQVKDQEENKEKGEKGDDDSKLESKEENKDENSNNSFSTFVVGAKLRSKFENVRLGHETLNVDSALGDDHYIEHRRKRICAAIRKGLPRASTYTCSISLGAGMEVRT